MKIIQPDYQVSVCLKASLQAPLLCAHLLQLVTSSEVREPLNLVFPTRMRSSLLPMIADHRIKHTSRRSVFIHPNDMAEPAESLDINTLSNIHVIEELPVGSNAVVIANSYWTKNRAQHFPLEHSQGSCIGP